MPEFAISTRNDPSTLHWQYPPAYTAEVIFTGLDENTTYYIFARASEWTNYSGGPVSAGTVVRLADYISSPAVDVSFYDGEVKIWADEGVVPIGAEFEVIAILQPPFPDRIVDKVNEQLPSSTIVAYYEIRLFDKNGDRILDFGDKEITIALKLAPGYENGKGISIYMEDPNQDGKLVKMESKVEDGYIIFNTSWLETY